MTFVTSSKVKDGSGILLGIKSSKTMASPAAAQQASDSAESTRGETFSSPGKRSLVLSLGLILLAVVVYSPVGKNAFINFDDNQYILANQHVRSGLNWETVKWAFTTYDAANWHPLTWLSHALDCQLFGLNPAGHHSIGVLLHAFNAVLLFLLLTRITGSTWRSLMVAALFAAHPLNVESVAWAAERKNLLSTFFFIAAIWAYYRYVCKATIARYSAVLICFALALMSKPQVITFPFVLLLLDYWPLRRTLPPGATSATSEMKSSTRSFSWLVAEKVPLFAFSALSAVITLRAQRAGDAVRTIVECSLPLRIENAVMSYIWYLRDSFFPWHLAPIYPYPMNLFGLWKVALAATILVSITLFTIVKRKSSPYLPVGWFWFLGVLIPMIGLVQVGVQARADRYMYLPAIGIFVIVIWGGAELSKRYEISMARASAIYTLALIVFSIITFHQISYWKNSETLWNYTLRVTTRNFKAEDNLAQELATEGRTAEAMVHFHNILNLHDWKPLDLIAFGMYEQRNGYTADAINEYKRALEKQPTARIRAVALSGIGSAYMDLNDKQQALRSFDEALRTDANNVQALIGTGAIAQTNGDLVSALRQYTKAASIEPSNLIYVLLGRVYAQSGRNSDAAEAYKHAQQISPDLTQTQSLADRLLLR
jgi:protein O-mannosyl-transferase